MKKPLRPKKRGSPYPPMTHLAYPMMCSTTAMPHKLSSVSMATTWALHSYWISKTMGLTPKYSSTLVKATVIPGAKQTQTAFHLFYTYAYDKINMNYVILTGTTLHIPIMPHL